MAYRNDVDALEARYRAVQAEVDEKTRARDDVARMLEEARARERNDELYRDFASGGPQRRRRRRIRIGVTLAAVVTIAMGGVFVMRHHHGPDRKAQIFREMERFTDQLCQCHDMQCVQGVSDEMTRWSQQVTKEIGNPPKLSDAEMKRATTIAERMAKCMQQAMSTSPPYAPDPPPVVE